MSDRLPDRIEGYRIETELAHGGMGVVYLAHQDFPERKVALKLLSPDLAADPDFRERFIRESNAAASTEHPNIVPIYGAGEADGRLYLAMRYIEGTDLGALIRRDGPLSPERAVDICAQVAAALDAAHARGLVHRDVKPGNILLDAGGHAYLTDFGLITRTEVETGITKTGQFMGSTAYCAPEQIRGDDVDPRTDVYSLGCVLFECLTGEPPFPRQNEAATLYAHLEETPTKPSARHAGIPPGLDVVVQKAMAKQPDWRHPSAGELASEARAAVGRPFPEARLERSRRWLWGAIAVALALVAVAAVVLVASGGSEGPPPTSGERATALALRQGLLATDPATGKATTKIPGQLGVGPFGVSTNLTAGEDALWTTDLSGPIRVDPSTGEISDLPVSQCGFGVRSVIGLGDAWIVCGARGDQVYRVDPFTLKTREIPITGAAGSGFPGGAGIAAGSLWTCWGPLYRVDALTERVDGPAPGVTADFCAVGEGSVWTADQVRSTVTPVDPNTSHVGEAISVPGDIDELAVGAGGVWVLDRTAGTVTRIDPRTGALDAPIGVGDGANSLATGLGDVWVTMPADRDVVRIDPLTRDASRLHVNVAATLAAPDPVTGSLWLVAVPPGSLD